MARTSLRCAEPGDATRLLPLIGAYHAFEGLSSDSGDIARIIAPLLADDHVGRIYFIEYDAEVVGYVVLCFGYSIEFGGRDAFVDEVFVVESHRNRGIGRAALEALTEAAAGLGVCALHLEVQPDNAPARKLYASLGFTPRNRYVLMTRRG